ncbi:MAG: carbon-nitrogen hydrolase family protein [Bacteroidales bacterium]
MNKTGILLQFAVASALALMCSCSSVPENGEKKTVDTFTLAMIQMEVRGGALDTNLSRAARQIEVAAASGARLALLPEMTDLGWTHPSAREMAYAIPDGKTCRFLCEQARKNRIFVCAGISENDGGVIYNAAVLIDPSGKVILKHRKLNELDIGHELYAQGDRLNVVHTELGTIGLEICADGSAAGNVLSKALGYMGAGLILAPSAWAVPPGFNNDSTPYGEPWLSAYREVSKLFDLWIVGVSNVGTITDGAWKGWDCIGNSLAFGPGGVLELKAPFGSGADTILYLSVTIKPRPARGTGWQSFWSNPQHKTN